MIPISVCNRPNVFMVSILIYLLQLFLTSSSCLHINQSTISFPLHIYSHSNSVSISLPMPTNQLRKLRRLPHVFSQVLELPLRSHADVFIDDRADCIRFVAKIDENAFPGQVKACAVKIHPGVTKVVVRGGKNTGEVELLLEKLEIDVWRFRLPASTRPELATAVVVGRELVVTVPKGARSSTKVGREVWRW